MTTGLTDFTTEITSEQDRALAEQLNAALIKLRPILQAEGGDARILSVADGVARIDMTGGCEGCGSGLAAMEGGLRLMLIERVTGLKDVVFVS